MAYKEDVAAMVELRKERVKEIAFALFADNGIETITMERIARAADIGVASVFRYFGSKVDLVIEIGASRWEAYLKIVEARYQQIACNEMDGWHEIEFYIDSYIDLYRNHKRLLKFNSEFDLFVMQQNVKQENLKVYYDSIKPFEEKFHRAYEKAMQDASIRADMTEKELCYGIMYTMLATASKYAHGTIYPVGTEQDYSKSLEWQKNIYMSYLTKSE